MRDGSTDELLTGLNYDSSWQLYYSRRIPTKYGDQLTDAEREVIETIMDELHILMVTTSTSRRSTTSSTSLISRPRC